MKECLPSFDLENITLKLSFKGDCRSVSINDDTLAIISP
ncbi:unnamed protein product [Brassica oleracea var. botrytis]